MYQFLLKRKNPDEELLQGLQEFLINPEAVGQEQTGDADMGMGLDPVPDPIPPTEAQVNDALDLVSRGQREIQSAFAQKIAEEEDKYRRHNPAPFTPSPSSWTPEQQRSLDEYSRTQKESQRDMTWEMGDRPDYNVSPGTPFVPGDSTMQAIGRLLNVGGNAVPGISAIPEVLPAAGMAKKIILGALGGDVIDTVVPKLPKPKITPSTTTSVASAVGNALQEVTPKGPTVRLKAQDFDLTLEAATAKLADESASPEVKAYAQSVIDAITSAKSTNSPQAVFKAMGNTPPSSSTTTSAGAQALTSATSKAPTGSSTSIGPLQPAPTVVPQNATVVPQAPTAPVRDLLNTRPLADVLKDPTLRDTGISGKIREGLGKLGRISYGLEKLHPGITKPADDLEAITGEFRNLRTKYESTSNIARQSMLDTAKNSPNDLGTEIGNWIGQSAGTALNNGAKPKWVASKITELNANLVNRSPEEQAEIAGNYIETFLSKAADNWTRDSYNQIAQPDWAKRYQLAKTGGHLDNAVTTGLNAGLTMIGASTDLSFMGIQLALTAPRHPLAFSRAVVSAMKAAADPTYMGRIYKQNAASVLDAAQHGVSVSRGGMADAFMIGAGVEKAIGDIPVVGGLFSGGNRAFAAGADAMRLSMWKSLREGAFKNSSEEELRELAKLLNRATGMTTTQTSGVEQEILFASRFFRSPIEMIGMIRSPGKVGNEARQMLGVFGAGATGFTYMFNAMLGKETITDPDDPNFLRVQARDVEFGGGDVSLYGPLHPYLQALGKAIKHGPVAAAKYAQENGLDPQVMLIALGGVGGAGADMLSTRLRPVLSIGKDLVQGEVFGGKSWELPNSFDVDQWSKFIGTGLAAHGTPFFIGGVLSNVELYQKLNKAIGDEDGKVLKELVWDTMSDLTGTRSAPPSMRERIDRKLKSMNVTVDGQKITTLEELDKNPKAKAQFYRDPTIKALIDVYQSDSKNTTQKNYYKQMETEYQNQTQRDEWLTKGTTDKNLPYSLDDWEADVSARYQRSEGARNLLTADNPAFAKLQELSKKKRKDNPNLSALDGYFDTMASFKPSSGSTKLPPEAFDAGKDYIEGLPEEQKKFVLNNLGTSYTPLQDEIAKKKRNTAAYYDAIYDVNKIEDEGLRNWAKKYESATTAAEKEDMKDDPEYFAWQDLRKDLKRDFLMKHPEMIEDLKFLQRIKTSPSEDDAKGLQKAKDSVESALKSIVKAKANLAKDPRNIFFKSNLTQAQNRLKMAEEKVSLYEEMLASTKEVEAGTRSAEDALRPPTSSEQKAAANNPAAAAQREVVVSGTAIPIPTVPKSTPKPAATPTPKKPTLPGRLY